LQKRLGAGVDGGFGPKTRDAVEAAQTAHGQQPTGKVTYKLWHALGLTSTPACEPGPAPISGGSGASGGSGSSGGSSGGSKGSSGGGDSVRQARIRARVAEIVDGLNGPAKTSDPVTHRALRFARTQIGKPYVYGGDGPNSYDCSGLVMAAYDAAAVALPRTAAQQYAAGPHVPLQHVRRGDLVYFASDVTKPSTVYHTGIYVGNGEILDAPHTGTDVQIQPLWATDLLPRAVRPTRALQLPVKRGDTGHTVSELQTALDHHGFNLGVDGGDGPQTTAAVKAWQAAMGTKQTGTVTKALWLTLGWNP
jgi:cell wall-associated NlpC family hydrolase